MNGSPASGDYDFTFTLFDASTGGNQIGPVITVLTQTLSIGTFSATLDFGSTAFQGDARWLQIAVRPSGQPTYTILSPRQALTPAPYAMSLRPGAAIVGTISSPGRVLGVTNNGTGNGIIVSAPGTGLLAVSSGTSGTGVIGSGNTTGGTGVSGSGYYGVSGQGFFGVYGEGRFGVWGEGDSGTGGAGVRGELVISNGVGIYGLANTGSNATGVYGSSSSGYGVYGISSAHNGVDGLSTAGSGSGVYGQDLATAGRGVYGFGSSYGVFGTTGSLSNGDGLYGLGDFGVEAYGGAYGVFAESTNGIGVYGAGGDYAGLFQGNVYVTGACCGSEEGSFKIDDPADPTNKYLNEAAVASPDMLDVYRGHVTLDADASATVQLPPYFQALNRDFDYQLTPVGAPMPGLYVAQEVKGNSFKIAGGKPGGKVSWQVTGVRQDPTPSNTP